MNNLHRELAPISDAAWAGIEDEARRTFKRNVAGRRVVDVVGPSGLTLAAVGTGHVRALDAPSKGVLLRRREAQPVIELRAPFTVTRQAVDDVERGAQDSDWQPVKDAAKDIAIAEDRAIFAGSAATGIVGIEPFSSNTPLSLPTDIRQIPDTVAHAVSALRLVGVDGPYRLLLSADLYTAVDETTDQGYPIRAHVARVLHEGEIIWAPALDGGLVITTRGGDYALHIGQELSIGYLAHDAEHIELYLEESLTFLPFTAEASVALRTG